ncbi:MAG: hypothetical protein RLZZ210_449 [Pseudomonadota bacterium]|jgi:hypothetical protein
MTHIKFIRNVKAITLSNLDELKYEHITNN